VRLVRALDHHRRVTTVPFQQPGLLAAFGLDRERCEGAAWAITPDGDRHHGAAAMSLAVAVALGFPWPMQFYRLPGVRQVQDRVYAWVARHRGRLPGDRPYCAQQPDACGETTPGGPTGCALPRRDGRPASPD
jgi:predicted DCC family thiol-disulfide oxidoreductase YuxK